MARKQGKFVVIEGGDYCGKTTFAEQLGRILALKHDASIQQCRLPGTGSVGERIRDILVNYELDDITRECLFKANRRVVVQSIQPLMNSGITAICTRWIQSAEVYQQDAQPLRDLMQPDYPDLVPDVFVLLYVSDETFNKAYLSKNDHDLLGNENIVDYKAVQERYNEAFDRFSGTKFKIEYNTGASKPISDEHFELLYKGLINSILDIRNGT